MLLGVELITLSYTKKENRFFDVKFIIVFAYRNITNPQMVRIVSKEVCTYIYDESITKREGNIGLHNVLIYTYTRQTIITIVVCTQPKSYQNISFIEYSRGKEKEGWYGIIVSAIQGV